MKVANILQKKGADVATIKAEMPISDVVGVLRDKDVGALVVSGDGRTVDGILSERDVVRGLAKDGAGLPSKKAGDLMTPTVKTCGPDDTVQDLMGVMTEMRIRHLPVVADGALCGIISIGDIVKARMDELENEASALRDYIAS